MLYGLDSDSVCAYAHVLVARRAEAFTPPLSLSKSLHLPLSGVLLALYLYQVEFDMTTAVGAVAAAVLHVIS